MLPMKAACTWRANQANCSAFKAKNSNLTLKFKAEIISKLDPKLKIPFSTH